jgi:hypothetical protein
VDVTDQDRYDVELKWAQQKLGELKERKASIEEQIATLDGFIRVNDSFLAKLGKLQSDMWRLDYLAGEVYGFRVGVVRNREETYDGRGFAPLDDATLAQDQIRAVFARTDVLGAVQCPPSVVAYASTMLQFPVSPESLSGAGNLRMYPSVVGMDMSFGIDSVPVPEGAVRGAHGPMDGDRAKAIFRDIKAFGWPAILKGEGPARPGLDQLLTDLDLYARGDLLTLERLGVFCPESVQRSTRELVQGRVYVQADANKECR